MYQKLHIDIETRSACDLKTAGLHVYANHPTTEILVVCYAFDDEPVQTYIPEKDKFPYELMVHIQLNRPIYAHNSAFEKNILNAKLTKFFDPIKDEQLFCTMSFAYAASLPASLAECALALGLEVQKDAVGKRNMMQLSKPKKTKDGSLAWVEDEAKFQKLIEYCKTDVEVERALSKKLLHLTKQERKVWLLDGVINDRGIGIYINEVNTAIVVANEESRRLDSYMLQLTGGAVKTTRAVKQLKDWLTYKHVNVDGLGKKDVDELLKDENLSEWCRHVLLCRKEGSKSSVAKLQAMKAGVDNGRLKGLFQYHGANTGRWSGRRVQLQNLPKNTVDQETIEAFFSTLHAQKPTSLEIISSSLRGFLKAEVGKRFLCADYSSIEARILAWLAGEEKVLEVFRGSGLIYEQAASDIFHCSVDAVTKEQRQIGKVAILALGYQGGRKAFKSMAKNYNLEVSHEQAETIKTSWRNANQKIVQFWHNLEECAISAVLSPGRIYHLGKSKISFKQHNDFLYCKLPSARCLSYPYPRIDYRTTPWGAQKAQLTYMTVVHPLTKKWVRDSTYGGKIVENCVQATARDILAEAMLRVEERGYNVAAHIHDELLCEVPEGFGSVEELSKIMCELPTWAEGLPLSAEGWDGYRYRK